MSSPSSDSDLSSYLGNCVKSISSIPASIEQGTRYLYEIRKILIIIKTEGVFIVNERFKRFVFDKKINNEHRALIQKNLEDHDIEDISNITAGERYRFFVVPFDGAGIVFIYKNKETHFIFKNPDASKIGELLRSVSYIIARIINDREYAFSHFPPALAEHYWNMQETRHLDPKKLQCPPPCVTMSDDPYILPPSMSKKETSTITLVLDLRKSTFAMAQATDRRLFAKWLSDFSELLTRIIRHNNGIFDKFTGDGVIAHFIALPGEKLPSIINASKCALEMIIGVHDFLKELEPILSMSNKEFGGGIGISEGVAHWSVDKRDNPVVVGKGVVDASRFADKARAGTITMSVHTAHQLLGAIPIQHHILSPITKKAFESKEYSIEYGVEVCELNTTLILPYILPDTDFVTKTINDIIAPHEVMKRLSEQP